MEYEEQFGTMNMKQLIEQFIAILTGVYNHNIEPMMEAFGEDCIMIAVQN